MRTRTVVLVCLLAVAAACERAAETEIETCNEGVMLAKIPGTDWEGCDADCKWVKRPNNKYKCVPDTCTSPCECRVFSRPKKNWDGEYEDEGDWNDDAQERENDKYYRCWCVKAAS